MFIQTEPTPNPNTIKFLPGQEVVEGGPYDFPTLDSAAASPLARTLFGIEGLARVFLGRDFVSLTKAADARWEIVKPMALAAIMDHFMSGLPAVEEDAPSASAAAAGGEADDPAAAYEGEAKEIVAEIVELIDTRVRPAVAQDGGDIVFGSFEPDTGIVKLHMRGACAGCPSSAFTLKQGIENMLRAYVPEVNAVEQVL